VPAENPEKLSEAILYLAKNPRKAAQLADSAYKKVCQRYSIKNTVNSYQDIYESALIRN
jgi:glycosyltransferase involved in cell wall biosynthesis